VAQAVLLERLLKRFGEVSLSLIGLISGSLVYLCFGLATRGWLLFPLIFANMLSFAVPPAMASIASKWTDPKEQGSLMGSMQSLNSLGIVFAPLLGAQMLAATSNLPREDWRGGALFYVAAALTSIGSYVAVRFFSRYKADSRPR
jgi:DHA1 family tetracycline resistance protein-like MFS transporter